MINDTIYYIISAVLILGVLAGISMMSKVKSANKGNTLSAICTLIAIVVVMYNCEVLTAWQAWLGLAIGAVVGIIGAVKLKMIEMPQAVALLNGFGGLASALVAILTIQQTDERFAIYVGAVALVVGWVTFTGSVVAAGKLHKLLPQKPVVWKAHSLIVAVTIIVTVLAVIICPECMWLISILSAFFGIAFAIRVGGADMPITISLLNSLSGVAGGIAGIAVGDILLVAIGGIVGASGLLLTQIMCRAMNRSLVSILVGGKAKGPAPKTAEKAQEKKEEVKQESKVSIEDILSNAKKVMIVPGYGMALGQAQGIVKAFADKLEANGTEVKYAIHPVAGRMPGHMNVLLCEVDVPYDKLYEMDAIDSEFKECDVAVIIGANDVVNPAANTAEGTPIYGMPVLSAGDAKNVIVCNFDDKPGYAGVPNPLYEAENTIMMLGDAKETVAKLTAAIGKSGEVQSEESTPKAGPSVGSILTGAKKVMIVPGYGMALGQAQGIVKAFADKLEANGTEVKYAIHPVAGRMPGHMNVLLCEVDVPYDKLYEMDAIDSEFKECDVAVIIGANDVVNPAANTAEGTPIYGMPVLSAGEAKHVIVCNFDDKPGYAGVPNPLYEAENTIMMLGDAKETVAELTASIGAEDKNFGVQETKSDVSVGSILANAKKAMIVPGYGMALGQAQGIVKSLADKLEANGTEVKYAIHPVAGRMPGHMNVLLCEVDVPYDKLYEMDAVDGEFKECDVAIIVGANDVVNPAANTAEGTPIYGMPVLSAGDAKNVIVCNFDDKPGYAGVPNPLYEAENTIMMLGDAKETVAQLMASF